MKATIFILAIISSSLVYGQSEPLEFKGIVLGSDITLIENDTKYICESIKDTTSDHVCYRGRTGDETINETIAGEPVTFLALFYTKRKLGQIIITFKPESFSKVAEALTVKYGEGKTRTELIQNQLGATFKNQIITWRKQNAIIEIELYYGKLDRSAVKFIADFAVEEFEKRRIPALKERAEDL
jgi:hypothetical protein